MINNKILNIGNPLNQYDLLCTEDFALNGSVAGNDMDGVLLIDGMVVALTQQTIDINGIYNCSVVAGNYTLTLKTDLSNTSDFNNPYIFNVAQGDFNKGLWKFIIVDSIASFIQIEEKNLFNGFFTTVGIDGDYPTISTALIGVAGKSSTFLIISDINEISDYTFTNDQSIYIYNPSGYTINYGQFSPFKTGVGYPAILNITLFGGPHIWDYTSSGNIALFNFLNAYDGSKIFINQVNLIDNTQAPKTLSYLYYGQISGGQTSFTIQNFTFQLPNIANCGFSSISSSITEGALSTSISDGDIIGGGSNCGQIMVGSFKTIENINIYGDFETVSGNLPLYNFLLASEHTVMRNITDYSTSGISIQMSNGLLEDITAINALMTLRFTIGGSIVNNVRSNGGRIIFGNGAWADVFGSSFASPDFAVGLNLINFIGCRFTNAPTLSFGISLGNLIRAVNFTNCVFDIGTQIFGQNMNVSSCVFLSGTLTIGIGTSNAVVAFNKTVTAVIDNGTNTQLIGNTLLQIVP